MPEILFTVRIINDAYRGGFQKVISSRLVLDLDTKTVSVYWGTSSVRETFSMDDVTIRTGPGELVDIILLSAEYERRYGK